MGGIGADGLIPFGGLIPPGQEADEKTKQDHEHPSFEDGVHEHHVTGAEPLPPTLNHPENLDEALAMEERTQKPLRPAE
jgi:hypothetical protein